MSAMKGCTGLAGARHFVSILLAINLSNPMYNRTCCVVHQGLRLRRGAD